MKLKLVLDSFGGRVKRLSNIGDFVVSNYEKLIMSDSSGCFWLVKRFSISRFVKSCTKTKSLLMESDAEFSRTSWETLNVATGNFLSLVHFTSRSLDMVNDDSQKARSNSSKFGWVI